ncbi:MAG: hypothetical protein COA43_14760 [Robiginitomaculum sp.]|nr:MAG: hypothetical protein COA43_14760 [Robiginitomaculum sp.]
MLANSLYTSIATVWPFVSVDDFTGAKVFGPPFTITCNWKADNKLMKDSNGREYVSNYIYYTAIGTVKRKDYIAKGDHLTTPSPLDAAQSEEIQDVKEHDCSYFNIPNDFFLVT